MRQFHPNAAVTTETDIVIEGFPRSANSFSVRSLRISHQSPVKIAHHLHIPAQLIFGVKRGIPTLLLLRNPLEAVTSLCIYEPRISPTVGLLGYILFYSPLKPYKEKMVIADFDTVTTNFNAVIQRLNDRFNLHLDFVDLDSTQSKVFAAIDRYNHDQKRNDVTKLNRPSEVRNALKSGLQPRVQRSWLFPKALKIYEEFLDSPRTGTSSKSNR
jgi:hypothetical protein